MKVGKIAARNIAVLVAAGLIGILLGVVIFRLLGWNEPPPPEKEPRSDRLMTPPPSQPALPLKPSTEEDALRRRVRDLEAVVAKAKAAEAHKPAAIASPGIPPQAVPSLVSQRIPFPAGLPEAFTPEGFHETLKRAIEECKLPYSIETEDCSEFPCVVVGDWDHAKMRDIVPSDCKPWNDAFPKTILIVSRGEDGGPGKTVFYPFPEQAADPRAANRAANGRAQALAAHLGGTP